MTQMQLIGEALSPSDVVYTADWAARDMVQFFQPTGRVLEPCRGDGAIYHYLPPEALWCEIKDGRDFFQWTEPVDWIISNPPYSLLSEFIEHSYRVADHIVYLVPLHSFFRKGSLMKLCYEQGWLKHVRMYGSGGKLGFPMGNPIAALYFLRGYQGQTSWSWYE